MTELKPCPFCGSTKVMHRATGSLRLPSHYISCEDCGGSGCYCTTETKAIAAWNQRATEASEAVATKTELEQAESALRFLSNEANRRADPGMSCGRRILERALALTHPEPPE